MALARPATGQEAMMTDTSGPRDARPSPASGARSRRHQLALADGGKLMLLGDRSIRHLDAYGATIETWAPDDPAWAERAIRFGLHPQDPTVAPQGHQVPAPKGKRW